MRQTPPDISPPPTRQRWQPRFGLGAMMLVMLVCGVMSSAGFYLVRGNLARPGQSGENGHTLQLVFLLITLASPLLLMAAISFSLQLARIVGKRRKPKS